MDLAKKPYVVIVSVMQYLFSLIFSLAVFLTFILRQRVNM